MNKKFFLGVDPGLRKTGWAVISSSSNYFEYVASGFISTNPSEKLAKRLLNIKNSLGNVIANYKIDYAGIEQTYVNSNNNSSLQLAHARAAAIISLEENNIEALDIPAKTIKKTITGSGIADKEQIKKTLSMMVSNLNIKNSDEADAVAIALTRSFL